MYELEEIRNTLKSMNLSKVAEELNIPYGRVWRIVYTDHAPKYETVKQIVEYLESKKLTKAA